MLTVKEVQERVSKIRFISGDDEMAHSAEDELYAYVLQSIANGTCEDPATCAKAALETENIVFARWCA